MKKKTKSNKIISFISAVIAFILIFNIINFITNDKSKIDTVSYNEFIEMVNDGKVDTVYYNDQNEYMTFTIFNEKTKEMSLNERKEYKDYTNDDKLQTLYPGKDSNFRERMLKKDVILELASVDSSFLDNIINYMPIFSILIMILVTFYLFKSMSGSSMSVFGEDSSKDIIQTTNKKFSDIIGHDEIIEDVKFITELIKNPKLGDKVGAKVPKGILLSGDPGCGKTLIAKAIAGEAGVTFMYKNASSFIDRFVGVGARRVREAFKLAKQHSPCVLFIDEIDAIGGDRDNGRGTSENDQTIDALLQEMDGFNGRDGIFIIAATNRPEMLDKALTRAGRFDRQIVVSKPRDWKERFDLFNHYLENIKTSDDINVENLSKQVSGFTGADIEAVCNEAAIVATMNNKEYVDHYCIEEAIDKKIFKGNRSKKEQYFKDKQIIAYHEAGHAVMSYLLKEPIARASIQSTVSGVGGVVFTEDKRSLLQSNKDFENDILISFGGHASEEIKFNYVTTGASNDITQATNTMKMYVEKFGFDKDFGLLDIGVLTRDHLINSSEITEKLSNMSKDLYNKCKTMLSENYDLVEILAQKLLDVETLSGEEIYKLFTK